MLELLTLAAQIGNEKAVKKVMPWAMDNPRRPKEPSATPDEIAAAEAALESGIVFAD